MFVHITFVSFLKQREHNNYFDFIFYNHLQKMGNSLRQRPLCSDECWQVMLKLFVLDPGCVNVVAIVDGVLKDHSVVVVWNNVGMPKNCACKNIY